MKNIIVDPIRLGGAEAGKVTAIVRSPDPCVEAAKIRSRS
jgi:hypothetical protein